MMPIAGAALNATDLVDRRQRDEPVAVERRKRGRPRCDAPMERIDLRFPPEMIDAIDREASRHHVKRHELIRRVLAIFVGQKSKPPVIDPTL